MSRPDANAGDPLTSRIAALVGFPPGLAEALTVLLTSRHFAIHQTPSASKTIELFQSVDLDLVVASNRCPPESIVELTAALGHPRRARVIVLLAGKNDDVERRYRDAGLRYVLTMPVTAEDLLRAGAPNT
jgi:DNA-binding response OmpR family regulator